MVIDTASSDRTIRMDIVCEKCGATFVFTHSYQGEREPCLQGFVPNLCNDCQKEGTD